MVRPHDRRAFLYTIGLIASAAATKGALFGSARRVPYFDAYPFQLGVASGDPDHESVVLWTRLAPDPLQGGGMPLEPVEVRWRICADEGMQREVRKGTVIARPEWAHSVHVEASGLQPDRWYWYQFKVGNEVSPVGRTRTTPLPNSTPDQLRFAFVSCQHYESGLYTAYEHMLREAPDLVVHLGDYIYEGKTGDSQIRKHSSLECISLDDYRNRHALYKTDPALQAMHAGAPWLLTWDDHEFDNNCAGDISEELHVAPQPFLKRRALAYKAYYEHMPLRASSMPRGPHMNLYRRVPYGRLADFWVLDTRQYRSDQPCDDGNKPPCEAVFSADGTLLGREQRDWLMKGMDRTHAKWNVLAQQVMMGRVDRKVGPEIAYSMDQWPGYEAERRQLLKYFAAKRAQNPVVIAGDIHTNWANELGPDYDDLRGAVVATEFVGTSLSSGGNGVAAPKDLDKLHSENPSVKFHNAERGYVSCTVTPKQWRSDFRTVEYVTRPGAPINTRASFIVEDGRPGLQRA